MKDDWVKVWGKVKEIEADYWRLDGLMEAEIERVVVNIGLEDGDEKFNEKATKLWVVVMKAVQQRRKVKRIPTVQQTRHIK